MFLLRIENLRNTHPGLYIGLCCFGGLDEFIINVGFFLGTLTPKVLRKTVLAGRKVGWLEDWQAGKQAGEQAGRHGRRGIYFGSY